jgi:acetyl esterase
MTREQMTKKVQKTRKMIEFFYRFKGIYPTKKGTTRMVDTKHGKIRVLEYGLENKIVSPLFVDLHGGGFIFMHADMDESMNLYFLKKTGVKIISIDYPKAPENSYPIAPEAVYEVVEYYVAHAEEFGIDITKIGIGGHSAGANLATVTCMRAKEKGNLSFCFQVLDYPPLDLATDPFKKPNPKHAIPPKEAALYNACYVDAESAKDPYVSPVFANSEQLKGLPPALIILAGGDSLHDEGAQYAEMLKKADVLTALHDFPNSAHGFTYWRSTDTDNALALMADFIHKRCYNKDTGLNN